MFDPGMDEDRTSYFLTKAEFASIVRFISAVVPDATEYEVKVEGDMARIMVVLPDGEQEYMTVNRNSLMTSAV